MQYNNRTKKRPTGFGNGPQTANPAWKKTDNDQSHYESPYRPNIPGSQSLARRYEVPQHKQSDFIQSPAPADPIPHKENFKLNKKCFHAIDNRDTITSDEPSYNSQWKSHGANSTYEQNTNPYVSRHEYSQSRPALNNLFLRDPQQWSDEIDERKAKRIRTTTKDFVAQRCGMIPVGKKLGFDSMQNNLKSSASILQTQRPRAVAVKSHPRCFPANRIAPEPYETNFDLLDHSLELSGIEGANIKSVREVPRKFFAQKADGRAKKTVGYVKSSFGCAKKTASLPQYAKGQASTSKLNWEKQPDSQRSSVVLLSDDDDLEINSDHRIGELDKKLEEATARKTKLELELEQALSKISLLEKTIGEKSNGARSLPTPPQDSARPSNKATGLEASFEHMFLSDACKGKTILREAIESQYDFTDLNPFLDEFTDLGLYFVNAGIEIEGDGKAEFRNREEGWRKSRHPRFDEGRLMKVHLHRERMPPRQPVMGIAIEMDDLKDPFESGAQLNQIPGSLCFDDFLGAPKDFVPITKTPDFGFKSGVLNRKGRLFRNAPFYPVARTSNGDR